MAHDTMFMRPPLPGEPHLVHRAFLRPDAERRERLHVIEVEEFGDQLRRLGVKGEPIAAGSIDLRQR